MSHGPHGGHSGEDAFDDQPLEDQEAYESELGFDDEPLDKDPYSDGGYAGTGFDDQTAGSGPPAIRRASPAMRSMRRGWGGGVVWFMLFMLFLLGTIPIIGTGLFLLYQESKPDPSVDETVDRETIVIREGGVPKNVTWTDASGGSAQKIRDLSVKVIAVSMGRARGRDDSNLVVQTGDEYLRIDLLIESFSRKPIEYVSWYGREVEQFSGIDRVRLFDADGIELTPHVFADVRHLEGTTPQKTLELRDEVRDALYFDLPKGADVPEEVGDLRLQIPLEGSNVNSAFRFQIPVSMIVHDVPSLEKFDPNGPADEEMTEDEMMNEEATP